MCITPLTLKRDYRTFDGEFTKVVPCGKCVVCLRRRQRSWAFRLSEQLKDSYSACFITLTYADAPISNNGHLTLKRDDFTKFWKRLRKEAAKARPVKKDDLSTSLKYYGIGEYGGKYGRPHYHAILFNLPRGILLDNDRLANIWGLGRTQIDACNAKSIGYVTNYCMNGSWQPDDVVDVSSGELYLDDREPHFSVMSKKLGYGYLTTAIREYHVRTKNNFVTLPGGQLTALPRYFSTLLFSKSDRKIISERAKEFREFNAQRFVDSIHELEWKKMLIRRQEMTEILERQKF